MTKPVKTKTKKKYFAIYEQMETTVGPFDTIEEAQKNAEAYFDMDDEDSDFYITEAIMVYKPVKKTINWKEC